MAEIDRGRNICNELGCLACCCHDVWFVTKGCEEGVLSWFPKAEHTYAEAMTCRAPGAYYCEYLGGYLIHVVGWCPNLDRQTRNCTRQENDRPPACSNFEVGSVSCDESRTTDGLLKISSMGIFMAEKVVK